MYLKRISKPVVNYDLIKTALGDKFTSKVPKAKLQKEESVFTEKDFKDFQKTYFGKFLIQIIIKYATITKFEY